MKRHRDDRGKVFGPRQMIPDLAALEWLGKTAVIVFDSDVSERPDLQIAEYRLAELLATKGAALLVVRLPKVCEDKTGLDDFLLHHSNAGPSELQRLIDAAVEPAMPNITGPMDIAKIVMAESFLSESGPTLRYWREDFWRFVRNHYVLVPEAEFSARILGWLDRRGFTAKPRMAADIVKCLASLSLVSFALDMPCWPDGDGLGAGWVPFENGLFRIGNPTAIHSMAHTARYFCPWALDFDFDAKAECPTWIWFLNEALDGDPQRIDLLQRWIGLLLTTDTSFQKLLLLIGPPRAGKGTVVRLIIAMMGRHNCASPSLSSLATRFGLSSLLNKTVATMPDAHLGKHIDGVRVAEVLKSVVGEDPQDVDRKYREPLTTVRLPTRFVISCNELAHFTDPSGALAARLSVIPFLNSYVGREDLSLEKRLQAELPGVVNWGLVGLARLRAEKCLNVPDKSRAIHENFKRLTSPVAAFMEDCMEQHPDFIEMVSDVFDAWVAWCRANGHNPGSDARLGERLRTVNPSVERVRPRQKDRSRPYQYKGIRLTPTGCELMLEGRKLRSADKQVEEAT